MQYEKIELLNSSSQGEVWLVGFADGKQAVLRRYQNSDGLYDMFVRLKAIDCDIIPKIYSIRQNDSSLEIIEEHIDGENLAAVMARGRRFTSVEARSMGLVLCDALEKLHNNNIIHRDIKPSNIMLTNEGSIRLIDFNAARAYDGSRNKDTRLLGTEGYAAPEQYGFSETDFRADIYSVGVTLKELCGDKLGSLKRAVNGCTEFDPKKRYKTVKALRKDIKYPYRREITGGIIAAFLIAAIVLMFAFVDVPKVMSELTGKAVYDADMANPVKVEYALNQSGDEYLCDGEGEIEFRYDEPLNGDFCCVRYDHPDAQFVTYTIPMSALCFRVSKDTNAVVDDLKITFEMHDIMLYSHGASSESVELGGHINGIGMYSKAVWTSDTALSSEEFVLDFNSAAVFGDDPHISVTVSADGFVDKKFNIAVKKSDSYIYPFSSLEHFEYIFDCEPLMGERLSALTTGMGEDYTEFISGDLRLISYEDITISFVVNESNIIIGLVGAVGTKLSASAQVGMTFDELEQGLASLEWTDEKMIMDGTELKIAIADIGGLDYRVYFSCDISVFAEL